MWALSCAALLLFIALWGTSRDDDVRLASARWPLHAAARRYNEAKVLFVIYLWHPRTCGVLAVYDKFLHPLLQQHEAQIDSSLADVNARFADNITRHFKK